MRIFMFIAIFCSMAALPAQAETQAWVQAVATGGYEARVITNDAACPDLEERQGRCCPMTVRAPAERRLSADLQRADTRGGGQGVHRRFVSCRCRLPRPTAFWCWAIPAAASKALRCRPATIRRPGLFPSVAAAAAKLKPDLVMHVGDYLYREEPCPPGNAGCAGSPSGDNWPSWNADFFAPAAPLLAAAPWVILRGNHEDCQRAGLGFLRLLGPDAFDPAAPCNPHLAPFLVSLGGPDAGGDGRCRCAGHQISIGKLVPIYDSRTSRTWPARPHRSGMLGTGRSGRRSPVR